MQTVSYSSGLGVAAASCNWRRNCADAASTSLRDACSSSRPSCACQRVLAPVETRHRPRRPQLCQGLASPLPSRSPLSWNDGEILAGRNFARWAARKATSGKGCTQSSRGVAVRAFMDGLPETGPIRDALFASAGAVFAFVTSAVLVWVMQRNERKMKAAAEERGPASIPQLGPAASLANALEMGMGSSQKESVEWVNMVLHKIWKVYRRSLEAWLVGLLQPAIDTLPLPSIVRRVEIAEFSLDYEPLSVRNVQRRASRRANDLQYHVGLRYTGDARCLLLLHLTVAGMDFAIPVGVHNLDVDAELWVKLRLTPRKPYVGTLSIAFVRLPTIKLVLAPFRIVNLFAIPFLSSFLSKLLTVDLPRLLVLPRHITFDFLPAGEDVSNHQHQHNAGSNAPSSMGQVSADLVLDLLKSETFTGLAHQQPMTSSAPARMEPSDAFVGELSVTLCEARNLPTLGLSVWSNPYCRLMVGDVVAESKKNSETSHPAGARDPVWNQDFLFWVEDPSKQKLTVVLRDSMAPLSRNIGFVEVPIWQLQDCAPLSMWLPLLQDSPFGVKPTQGEIRLLLTYKSYVDKEADQASPSAGGHQAVPPADDVVAYIKVFGEAEEAEEAIEVALEETESGSDSDRERELELQRERQAKGLDKLGEAPGVEVVASNVGLGAGQAGIGAGGAGVAGLAVGDGAGVKVGLLADTPSPPQAVVVAVAGPKAGVLGTVWGVTKAVAGGAGAVAGAAIEATSGFLVATSGVVAAGAEGLASGAGAAARAVKGLVARDAKEPEHLYVAEEEEDYFEHPIKLRSFPEGEEASGSSYEGERDGAAESGGKRGDAQRVPGDASEQRVEVRGDEYLPSSAVKDIGEAVYGPYSKATVEQRVARLVEWNLASSKEDILQSMTTPPRLVGYADTTGMKELEERDADSKSSHRVGATDSQGSHADTTAESITRELGEAGRRASDDKAEEGRERWRTVQGAISDLMDFFSR